MYGELAAARPDVFLPTLTAATKHLVDVLDDLNRQPEATAARRAAENLGHAAERREASRSIEPVRLKPTSCRKFRSPYKTACRALDRGHEATGS
jgi:hypothetical protein